MSDDPAPLELEIIFESGDWAALGPDPEGFVSETLRSAFAGLRAQSARPWPGPFALGVTFISDAAMQDINRDHRDQDKPTNVLSFPAWEGEDLEDLSDGVTPPGLPPGEPAPLGDILMAAETVAREAAAQGKRFADHARHLLVHGFLHLAGHDHISDDEAEEMEALEIQILRDFSISNPYLETSNSLRDL